MVLKRSGRVAAQKSVEPFTIAAVQAASRGIRYKNPRVVRQLNVSPAAVLVRGDSRQAD